MSGLERNLIGLLIGIVALIGAFILGMGQGKSIERADWQAKEITRQAAEQEAVHARLAENGRTRLEQEATNRRIADDYETQIAHLRTAGAADRAAVDRAGGLRVSRAVCDPVTRAAEAASERLDHETAAATVRLPQPLETSLWDIARDADELTEQARACQAWITDNGFYGGR